MSCAHVYDARLPCVHHTAPIDFLCFLFRCLSIKALTLTMTARIHLKEILCSSSDAEIKISSSTDHDTVSINLGICFFLSCSSFLTFVLSSLQWFVSSPRVLYIYYRQGGMHGHGKIFIFRSVYLGSQCLLSVHVFLTCMHSWSLWFTYPWITTQPWSLLLAHSLTHSLWLIHHQAVPVHRSTHAPSDLLTHPLT